MNKNEKLVWESNIIKNSIEYLESLAAIRTPEWYWDNRHTGRIMHEIIKGYCELRNYAKDLLDNPKDQEAKKRLNNLVATLRLN